MAATSIAALVAANLVPLYGVLFRGWSVLAILVLYWIESGIIGALNVAEIAMARGRTAAGPTRFTINGRPAPERSAFLVLFFVMHYGIFWLVHGVFVFLLPLFANVGSSPADGGGDPFAQYAAMNARAVAIGAVGLAISHSLSFAINFVGGREYLTVSPAEQMFSVYGRVFVLHATVLGGALLLGWLGTPVVALVILITGKIILDIAFHLRQHRRARAPLATV